MMMMEAIGKIIPMVEVISKVEQVTSEIPEEPLPKDPFPYLKALLIIQAMRYLEEKGLGKQV